MSTLNSIDLEQLEQTAKYVNWPGSTLVAKATHY